MTSLFSANQNVPHPHALTGFIPNDLVEAQRLCCSLLQKHPLHRGQLLRFLQHVPASHYAALPARGGTPSVRIPLEQEIGHEDLTFVCGLFQWLRNVTHVEILPRFIDPFPELPQGKPGDLPRQPVRLFVLPRPHVVDRWSIAGQAAVLVLLAATAGTGIVSSDLLTRMKGHNVATLSRGAVEQTSQKMLCEQCPSNPAPKKANRLEE
jgi:hypothetical protein